jgi:hypothetical protein
MIGSVIHEDRRRKISSMDVSIWWLDVYAPCGQHRSAVVGQKSGLPVLRGTWESRPVGRNSF